MKDWESENYGDLIALRELGKDSKIDYTTAQLIDENFKNKDGESNIEVRNRMNKAITEILEKYKEKRIIIVSHGAAIKFYLQKWCEYDQNSNVLKYNNNFVCHKNIDSPSVIRIEILDNAVINIDQL